MEYERNRIHALLSPPLLIKFQSPISTRQTKGNNVSEIQSPCILICAIDQKSGLCFGCGRTPIEITGWIEYSHKKRTQIMGTLEERLSTLKRRPKKETKRKRLARLLGTEND